MSTSTYIGADGKTYLQGQGYLGPVDPNTLKPLNGSAPVAAPAPTQTQTQPTQTAAAPAPSASSSLLAGLPSVNLQQGDTGANVVALQKWLVAQGLMTQQQVNTGPGIYGPQTTAAVKKMQELLGVDNSTGPGDFGPRTQQALQQYATTQTSAAGAGNGAASTGTAATGATGPVNPVKPTGDSSLDTLQNGIAAGANTLVEDGFTIPSEYAITADTVKQFLTYAHTALDPVTSQMLTSRLSDINSSLGMMSTEYLNALGAREQQFGTDLATEQNNAGNAGTAFSGQRNINEQNMQNTANRDLSTLGATTAYNMGAAARAAGADLGPNAHNIVLPSLAGGSVSLAGGQRGSTVDTGPLALNFDPSVYTAGNIQSTQAKAIADQQAAYERAYAQLASTSGGSGRSVSELMNQIPGINTLPTPSATGAQPSSTTTTNPAPAATTPTIPSASTSPTPAPTTDPYTVGQEYKGSSALNTAGDIFGNYVYQGNGKWSISDPVHGTNYGTATTDYLKGSQGLI